MPRSRFVRLAHLHIQDTEIVHRARVRLLLLNGLLEQSFGFGLPVLTYANKSELIGGISTGRLVIANCPKHPLCFIEIAERHCRLTRTEKRGCVIGFDRQDSRYDRRASRC